MAKNDIMSIENLLQCLKKFVKKKKNCKKKVKAYRDCIFTLPENAIGFMTWPSLYSFSVLKKPCHLHSYKLQTFMYHLEEHFISIIMHYKSGLNSLWIEGYTHFSRVAPIRYIVPLILTSKWVIGYCWVR